MGESALGDLGIFALGLFAFLFFFSFAWFALEFAKFLFPVVFVWHQLQLFGENNSGFSSTDGHFLRHLHSAKRALMAPDIEDSW